MASSKSREPGAIPDAGFIPLAIPNVGKEEMENVRQCIETGWVSSVGSFVDDFENGVAERVGSLAGVALTTGTAALHLALRIAGVKRDHEVLVSALTFIAPANAVAYTGAVPVFIDAEPDYWQIDPVKVEAYLNEHCEIREGGTVDRRTRRVVSALVVVDALGHPADLDELSRIADAWGLALVEDAAEALGATYRGRPIGSNSRLTCLSFNGNKTFTCGGGGMIVTNDQTVADRARYLSTQAKDDPIQYVHGEVGYNYRMTNVQAAIGCAQLDKMDAFIQTKRDVAMRYNEFASEHDGFHGMPEAPWAESSFWLYTLLVDPDQVGMSVLQIIDYLGKNRVQARPLWQPLHLSSAHGPEPGPSCPIAEDLHRRGLSLPCSTGLTAPEQDRVIGLLEALGSSGAG